MLAELLAGHRLDRMAAGDARTERARRRLMEDARTVMAGDPELPLIQLASAPGGSPSDRSRMFVHCTGDGIAVFGMRMPRRPGTIAAGTHLARPQPVDYDGEHAIELSAVFGCASHGERAGEEPCDIDRVDVAA